MANLTSLIQVTTFAKRKNYSVIRVICISSYSIIFIYNCRHILCSNLVSLIYLIIIKLDISNIVHVINLFVNYSIVVH